jgi:hypothetical protein
MEMGITSIPLQVDFGHSAFHLVILMKTFYLSWTLCVSGLSRLPAAEANLPADIYPGLRTSNGGLIDPVAGYLGLDDRTRVHIVRNGDDPII